MKIKKALALLLVLCLTLAMVPATAFAESETSGTCGANITWSYSDGTLSIQGSNGMMDAYAFGDIDDNYLGTFAPPWYTYHNQIHTIIVYNGVREIGSFAFCNSSNLTSVTLPNSLTYIWDYAFYGCSSLTDVYYSGSVEQWEALQIDATGNNSLTSATIHYNSTGPGTGSTQPAQTDPAPDPTEPSQPSPSTGATEPAQDSSRMILAKFKAIDVFTNTIFFHDGTSYVISDNAKIDINGLVDKWVVCEIQTASQGERLLSMQPIKMEPVLSLNITPIPKINYKNGQMAVQDNTYYKVGDFAIPVEIIIKCSINLYNPDPTKVSGATLEEWKQLLSNDANLGAIVNSVVFEAPSGFNFKGNSKELVGGDHDIFIPVGRKLVIQGGLNVDKTYKPATAVDEFQINGTLQTVSGTQYFTMPFKIYNVDRIDPNLPSGSYVISDEDLKSLNDYFANWIDAFNKFIEVVGQEMQKTQKNGSSSIEDQAKALMDADKKSSEKYLTFSPSFPSKYKEYVYQALCSALLKVTSTKFDFSKVKLNDYYNANTGIVNEIAKKLSSVHEYYTFGNLEIEVNMVSFAGANFGGIICTEKSSGREYTPIVVCSKPSDVNRLVAEYLTELSKLEYRAVNGLYGAFAKDFIGKPLSTLTEKYLAKKVTSFMQTRLENIQIKGFVSIVASCNAVYLNYNDFLKKVKKVDFHELDKIVDYFDVDDDTVKNTNAKKAVAVLKKAQESLVTAVNEYVTTGKVTTLNKNWVEGIISWFSCPVNISIYSNGKQIGYIGDDDVWYSEGIYAVERGGAKIIYSELGVPLTFEVTGTENGTVSYAVEERVNGNPTGRLNYYNLPVSKGTKYTVNLSGGDINDNQEAVNVTTGGRSISASEYISSDTDACVTINARENNSDRGVIIGEGEYVRGNAVVLYAYPSEGYYFLGWYNEAGAIISTKAVYEFAARNDLTLIARFESYDLSHMMIHHSRFSCTVRCVCIDQEIPVRDPFFESISRFPL